MSVRQALLALLEQGPMYGYQLRAEFEQRTGATWPLNVGQVYTTLTRLERDGLVERRHGGRRRRAATSIYRVTEAGRDEVVGVVHHAGRRAPSRPRDELAIKLALAVTVPGVDVGTVDPAAAHAPPWPRCRTTPGSSARAAPTARRPADLAWSLVLDSLVFAAEAEVRWLDHCEARLRRAAAERRPRRAPTPRPSRRADATTDGAAPMSAVLAACDDVTRVHGEGATEVHALRGGHLRGARRRAGRRDGPVRLRQVDAADPGRRAGPPTVRRGARSRAPTWRRSATAAAPRMRRTSIGYVFQDFNLIPALTAAENVALPARARRRAHAAPPAGSPAPRSRRSASASSPTASPTRCPAASSSGSRSPARSSASAG